jgi:microcystin-dependent protein
VFLAFGSYKQRLTTEGGTELSTIDEIPNPEPFSDAFTLDTTTVLNTGDIWGALKNGTRSGAVRLNGRTIGSAASSGTERANVDCADLYAYIWDNTANAQCPVATGRGATAAADFAANKAITLPDWRAVAPIGFDDMGNTAASLLGSAPVVTGSGILAGSILGANTHTLLTAETPAHTHTFSATSSSDGAHTHTGTTSSNGSHAHTITITDPGHFHNPGGAAGANFTTFVGSGGGSTVSGGTNYTTVAVTTTNTTGITASSDTVAAHTHTFTTSSDGAHTHTISGTTGSIGSGSAHNNLARSAPITWFIKL